MLRRFLGNYKKNAELCFYATTTTTHGSTMTLPVERKLEHTTVSLDQSQIDEAVKLQPLLSAYPTNLWHQAHRTFVDHGLDTFSFLRIAVGNPLILTRTPQKNRESMEYWRICQFGEKLLHLLLTKYPELLNVEEPRIIVERVSFLKSFVSSNKNVWKLIMNSPDVMEQSEKSVEAKIDYIRTVMRIEIPEILKSCALSQPLKNIRCRHVFLERLRLFIPRSLKSDPNEPTKNHRLYQITDTSEKTFATKICHVKLEEFEAFKDLYERELERKSDENEEEDLND